MRLLIKYLDNYNKEWGILSSSEGNSGYDIRAAIPEKMVLKAGERAIIPNGISVKIDTTERAHFGTIQGSSNVEIQLRPRSGLAAKKGITVVNTPGTIDYSYHLEIKTILLNTGSEDFEIEPGDRIAQLVVCPIFKPEVEEVQDMDDGTHGEGFGSSGVK